MQHCNHMTTRMSAAGRRVNYDLWPVHNKQHLQPSKGFSHSGDSVDTCPLPTLCVVVPLPVVLRPAAVLAAVGSLPASVAALLLLPPCHASQQLHVWLRLLQVLQLC